MFNFQLPGKMPNEAMFNGLQSHNRVWVFEYLDIEN